MGSHFFHLGPADRKPTARTARHQVVGLATGANKPGTELADLLLEERDIVAGRQSDDIKPGRQRTDDIERLAPDGAGRAQYGETNDFHGRNGKGE